MSLFVSPGPCPICSTAHCACVSDTGPIVIVQLPGRDAMPAEIAPVPLVAEIPAPLGDGSDDRPFSTGTYRGKKRR